MSTTMRFDQWILASAWATFTMLRITTKGHRSCFSPTSRRSTQFVRLGNQCHHPVEYPIPLYGACSKPASAGRLYCAGWGMCPGYHPWSMSISICWSVICLPCPMLSSRVSWGRYEIQRRVLKCIYRSTAPRTKPRYNSLLPIIFRGVNTAYAENANIKCNWATVVWFAA